MRKLFLIPLVIAALSQILSAQTPQVLRNANPYGMPELGKGLTLDQIRDVVRNRLAQRDCSKPAAGDDALFFLGTAELLKRLGDYDAVACYEAAIIAAGSEPAFDLFYAEYLRNFRGAKKPLFPQAEEHYLEARQKLSQLRESGGWKVSPGGWDDITEGRVERGLIALYQEDGFPLVRRAPEAKGPVPVAALATINAYSSSAGDVDRVDDTSALTAEVLFSQGPRNLKQALSADKLRQVIRSKEQRVSLNRLRMRYRALPAFDVFYEYRDGKNSQTTGFSKPGVFNDIRIRTFGFTVDKPFSVGNRIDMYLKAGYSRALRNGLIEYLPGATEKIDQFEGKAAVSRFVGPDKLTIDGTFVRQNIRQEIANPIQRGRTILAMTVDYGLYRPLTFNQDVYQRRFETRGFHFFAGFADDRETYASDKVIKNDYFAGVSLQGIGRFDVTLQPTIFRGRVTNDPTQKHSEYRTNINVLFRLLDEERRFGELPKNCFGLCPAFVHFLVPFRHDKSISGVKELENYSVAGGLDTKFLVVGSHRTSFLFSIRGGTQRFYKLDKSLGILTATVSMGF